MENITAFNKDYFGDLKSKFEADGKMFQKVENSLSDFQETLSKVALSSQSSISQDSISAIVSSIKTSFKIELASILDLALHLPTNAPRPIHIS